MAIAIESELIRSNLTIRAILNGLKHRNNISDCMLEEIYNNKVIRLMQTDKIFNFSDFIGFAIYLLDKDAKLEHYLQ